MQSLCYVRYLKGLWEPAQAHRLLRVAHLHRSARQLQHKKVMEDNKPWALFSEVGEQGYVEEVTDIMKQHFNLICLKDFLQNPQLHGPKIKVMFVWAACPDSSVLSLLPSLMVVANGGVGIDHLDVPYINSLGVKVTNTPGVVSDATADIAMALLLASARKVVQGHQVVTDPKITHAALDLMGFEVTGSTLGIIGMGDIGSKIARRARGFDMKILYHNRNRRSVEDEQAVGASYCENMDDLLRESDFVMLAVNLTPETTRLISHRELSLMKPTATLVNISRGLVVDQDALVKALQSGTILAAALDVTHPEPLPRDHPLLSLPNVVITPHVGTSTLKTTRKMVQLMVDNTVAAVNGKSIPTEVKPK
uniref:probable 2-ketogluconate reductase isoform X2 n=2 Tax=Semicossyphus pulcher TaxID=241346 RepID=UPI0037E92D14